MKVSMLTNVELDGVFYPRGSIVSVNDVQYASLRSSMLCSTPAEEMKPVEEPVTEAKVAAPTPQPKKKFFR